MEDDANAIGSTTTMKCCNRHKHTMSLDCIHLGSNPHKSTNYKSNIKSIILGYIHGSGTGNLDAMVVLLDLPNGRTLTRSFSRHEAIVRTGSCSSYGTKNQQ